MKSSLPKQKSSKIFIIFNFFLTIHLLKLKCYKENRKEKIFKFAHNLSEMEARKIKERERGRVRAKGKRNKIYVETFERAWWVRERRKTSCYSHKAIKQCKQKGKGESRNYAKYYKDELLLSEIKFLFCNSAQTKITNTHTYVGNKNFILKKTWNGRKCGWCIGWFVGFLLWNEKLTLILVPSSRACKPFKFILFYFCWNSIKYNHLTAKATTRDWRPKRSCSGNRMS